MFVLFSPLHTFIYFICKFPVYMNIVRGLGEKKIELTALFVRTFHTRNVQ
jgi:hypothetical protein